jgi:hypothetical protein
LIEDSRLFSNLPPIKRLDFESLPNSLAYIGTAGFEPRTLFVLERLQENGKKLSESIAIKYLPFDPRNKENDFKRRIEGLCKQVKWVTFNRHDPETFQNELVGQSIKSDYLLVDISGMSKFLVMILLESLKDYKGHMVLAYVEAQEYLPTKAQFEEEKKRIVVGTPDFITSDVFRILHVTSLSSSSMQGYPILLIAYPTFNHNEIVALHNEISPHCMEIILGIPHEKRNEWRLDAVKEINQRVLNDPDYCKDIAELSTFDYLDNMYGLQKIYSKYKYTHRILLAPTGSKMQTLAAFFFRQVHPDIQIVYPSTKSFIGEYSDGGKALWCCDFPSFSDSISQLDKLRR